MSYARYERFFLGTLYGGLLGDAYGAPFELQWEVSISKVLNLFTSYLCGDIKAQLKHTDDTVMSLGICNSLRESGGFNEKHLATRFVKDFFEDKVDRLYGGSIKSLFLKISSNKFNDASKIAASVFGGTGSYGNGAGMRIAPAALYVYGRDIVEFNRLIMQVTAVTHSHPQALHGALLHAHAIRHILDSSLTGADTLDPVQLIDSLKLDLQSADLLGFAAGENPQTRIAESLTIMHNKLTHVKEFVLRSQLPSVKEVVEVLGNDELAANSIPTALYVFLRSLGHVPGIDFDSLPIRSAAYAISLGFDTDTIACMAGNLAGAWVGAEDVSSLDSVGTVHFPKSVLGPCEGLAVVTANATWLASHCEAAKAN